MFSAYQNATRTYRDVAVETRAAAADPLHLILMLYDGAIDALTQAQAHIKSGNQAARQQALSRAVRIVDEGLSSALDPGGGEITARLRELYGYMTRRILSASLTIDAAPLAEVQGLLKDLRGAWRELDTHRDSGVAALAAARHSVAAARATPAAFAPGGRP